MDNYEEMLKNLENQEKELQFIEFTNDTALKLGLHFIEKAKKEGKRITIDITRNGQQLFHYAFEGTSPDNDQWIIRKTKVVNRFHRSSLLIGTRLKVMNKTIEDRYFINSQEYTPYGGAFPIIIKNIGVVGTVAVSGLAHEEDHQLVVDAIREFLSI